MMNYTRLIDVVSNLSLQDSEFTIYVREAVDLRLARGRGVRAGRGGRTERGSIAWRRVLHRGLRGGGVSGRLDVGEPSAAVER